jgi:hypothetical protein
MMNRIEALPKFDGAILTLDDLILTKFEDKGAMKIATTALAASQRPHMTLERRERSNYTGRKLWHPLETKFFDPKWKPSSIYPPKNDPVKSTV